MKIFFSSLYSDAAKRLNEARSNGSQNQSAEEILMKLHKEVKDLSVRRENIESSIIDRGSYLEKLQSWDATMDRVMTEQDVREKQHQVQELEDMIASYQDRLDVVMERNPRLGTFRQTSAMALKKFREKEEELEKIHEEKRKLTRLIDEKEAVLRSQGKMSLKTPGKADFKKYEAVLRDKIVKYKKMREELSNLRAELVVLQRTEQILKSRHKNLDEFLADLEKKQGVEVDSKNLSHLVNIFSNLFFTRATEILNGSL
jgi:intraflagellar transport protein 81